MQSNMGAVAAIVPVCMGLSLLFTVSLILFTPALSEMLPTPWSENGLFSIELISVMAPVRLMSLKLSSSPFTVILKLSSVSFASKYSEERRT